MVVCGKDMSRVRGSGLCSGSESFRLLKLLERRPLKVRLPVWRRAPVHRLDRRATKTPQVILTRRAVPLTDEGEAAVRHVPCAF